MNRWLITFFMLFSLSACATSPTGRSQLMLVSPESAVASSRQAYVQTIQPLQKDGKVDSDPALSRRVRLITGRIIAQAIISHPEAKKWQWDVKVIDADETVNAWCMAGGKMAVYTGIVNKLKLTDDELAQVMAHEISHALANHTAEKMSVAMASSIGTLGMAIATRDSDNRGAIMSGTVLAASLAVTLPNSRAAENEADVMGIKFAALAGYDPRAAGSLWEKMAKEGGSRPAEFLSTHPAPANRQATLAALAQEMMPYYLDKKVRPVYQLP
ncbi:M48 family metallopeptidase [Desulfotalea psychrophila]|nr:M48 family metallopeptidase [Desulfotalea psychrophila]